MTAYGNQYENRDMAKLLFPESVLSGPACGRTDSGLDLPLTQTRETEQKKRRRRRLGGGSGGGGGGNELRAPSASADLSLGVWLRKRLMTSA